MQTAKVIQIGWADKTSTSRKIEVIIEAKDSIYIEEPNGYGFPQMMGSATLLEGFNLVLEFGHNAVNAIKNNNDFSELAEENRQLRVGIRKSLLADRVRQLLSALDYDQLTDFQAKCVLLVEKELK